MRRSYAWWLGLFLLMAGGCAHKSFYVPDQTRQVQIVQGLPVAGSWSQPMAGLRCRIRLDRDSAGETSSLGAAVEIQNAGSQPIELSSASFPGSPPFSGRDAQWLVGGQAVAVDAPQPAGELNMATLQLAPGQSFVIEPIYLLVPPGAGLRQIEARFPVSTGLLAAPAVPLQVREVEWGPAKDGARLRLASANSTYIAGSPLLLRAFVQNLDSDKLAIHPPDWSTLDFENPRQRFVLQVQSSKEAYADIPRGQVWWSQIPNLPLLAPGKYIVRLEIDSPELPLPNRPAWHGKLVSNELAIEVLAK